MIKTAALFIILLLQGGWLLAQKDTASVYFPFNESVLTDEAKFRLDSAIYKGVIPATLPIQIIGYADAVGKDSFNLRLSRRRATSVKEYLVGSGFRAEYITLVTGKGEAFAAVRERPGGNSADRRVDVVRSGIAPKIKSRNTFIQVKSEPAATQTALVAKQPLPAPALRKASATDIGTVRVGETVVLDNIYFYAGKHVVRKESDESLDALVEALKAHPEIKIRIEGHVCCVPITARDAIDDETGHEELSVNRAIAIRGYLVAHGIAAERLSFMGFGHRHPLIPFERSEEDANQNRRVEIRIVE